MARTKQTARRTTGGYAPRKIVPTSKAKQPARKPTKGKAKVAKQRCERILKSPQRQCKRMAASGSKYCWQHK